MLLDIPDLIDSSKAASILLLLLLPCSTTTTTTMDHWQTHYFSCCKSLLQTPPLKPGSHVDSKRLQERKKSKAPLMSPSRASALPLYCFFVLFSMA